jgi:hypothetical protein
MADIAPVPSTPFATAQRAVADARAARAGAALAAVKDTALAATAAAALAAFDRTANPASRADAERRATLAAASQQAAAQVTHARADLASAEQAVGAALARFAEFDDPRRGLAQLSDRSPIALFPVRLETRFMTVPQRGGGQVVPPPGGGQVVPPPAGGQLVPPRGGGQVVAQGRATVAGPGNVAPPVRAAPAAPAAPPGVAVGRARVDVAVTAPAGGPAAVAVGPPQHQLWVRIYPDDCSIDTFQPLLSAGELSNAQRYWRGTWRAGGDEGGQRAAWRDLVAAHGSGRAGWIVEQYQPVNLAQQPTKAAPADEILVIGTLTPLPPAQAAAAATYWVAVRRAGDDQAAVAAARAALDATAGTAAAASIVADYRPDFLSDVPVPPPPPSTAAVTVAFVVFPADPPLAQQSWSTAPSVSDFPDRFVLLGYQGGVLAVSALGAPVVLPLHVAPDPTADPSDSIHPQGEDLFVPDQLRWMVDFERAQQVGMGIVVDLTPEQARAGFDRVLVLGVQTSASDADGQQALETLLRHHASGRTGLSLVPQGTPTHNTKGAKTGWIRLDDADQSFDDRRALPLFTPTSDPLRKRDGQWLAELLGVDTSVFTSVHAAGGLDQSQSRAMQRAVWPATLGYWMDKMLTPVFDDAAVAHTRWFYTEYVSGRGPLPALRIGGQPYGILPTTAFTRIGWLTPDQRHGASADRAFLARLLAVLRVIDQDWTGMAAGVAHLGRSGDAQQTLLDIIGLHPSSVEFYSRYAESVDELFNIANLGGTGAQFWQALVALGLELSGEALLTRLGWTGTQPPDILKHFFATDADPATKVIDDRALSETDLIRAYTPDGRNYVRWLADAAATSLDAVRAEQGFTGNVTPQALLYLFLRHAVMLGYYDTSYQLHRAAGFLTPAELTAMKPEPVFVHVAAQATASESRFAALYKTEPRITASPSLLVTDYITANLASLTPAADLRDQIEALTVLADAPTAALERAFAEHIDTCGYRLDSWLLGVVNHRLHELRYGTASPGSASPGSARIPGTSSDAKAGGGAAARTGVYLGAYAWLEDLRPAGVALQPVDLPSDLVASFAGPTPLLRDPANGGYVHAPSLPHARTAAVLRSGYLANATPSNPSTLSVNLSSDRVRLALSMLEGVRNGQSIGALLGYRFERGLHDDHGLAEVDKFIYPLRKAFPLVADGLSSTQTPPGVPIEAIEARNVLDGRKLLAQVTASGARSYPFGLTTLPSALPPERDAINAQVDAMFDVFDAIADVALAEGVHQAVQGNFERVAATVDAYASATFPPEPEVVQTPATGIGLTHRVATMLVPGLTAPVGATPRAVAEPAVDAWLASMLPNPSSIACMVTYVDPVGGTHQTRVVTLADLGLRPIDVLGLVSPVAGHPNPAMTELDDRVVAAVMAAAQPRADADLRIEYQTAPAGRLSVFQAAALFAPLATLVRRARPLRATDVMRSGDATPEANTTVTVSRPRIAGPLADLAALDADVTTLLGTLTPLVADPVANRAAIIAGTDTSLATAVSLLERAARFGLPSSGWGFAYTWRRAAYADLLARVEELTTRWSARLADFDSRIAAYDALPVATAEPDRFVALQAAELLVAATLDPLPATAAALRAHLVTMRGAFQGRLAAFQAVTASSLPTFTGALASVRAQLPVSTFDTKAFDLTPVEDRAITLATDLVRILGGHHDEITRRRAATQAQLDLHDAAASDPARADALAAAATALLGPEFLFVPEFAPATARAQEWANAYAAGSGPLLAFLRNTAGVDFPVEEWLTGAARVRPTLAAWEAAGALAEAFGATAPALLPAQFPYAAGDSWAAMQLPPTYGLDGDRLCFTAHYPAPFDPTASQCGLLLDEWTEVIPGTSRDTGITFNFDRPDNEAPQAILLVTPATGDGVWHWDDLVAALHETLDLAKKRAVEPGQIDPTTYARFLPATIMAATKYGISISTIIAAVNAVATRL